MMTREEAIEVLRRTTEYFKKDKDFRFREAVETLVPEFNETEDERIRKHLIEMVELYWGTTNDPDKAKDIDWLERHKDPQTPGIEIGKSYKCIASPRFTCFRKGEVYVVEDEWMAKLFSVSEGCFEAVEHPKEHKFNVGDTIRLKNSYAEYTIESISGGRYYCKGCSIDIDGCDADYELVQQKPILEVFGFKVGDAVRLKDGDGRKHIIKSFEEVEGIHGPNFYQVEFEDDSARDGIYPGEEYPNGYYTKMEKIEEEQKPADLPPGFYFIDQDGKKYYSKEFRFGDMKMKVVEDKSEKPVWSDEDKKIVETICKEGDLKPSEKRWLKSLPERFNFPPKQEWSEEDSDNLERVDNYLWMLDDYVGDDCAIPQEKTDKIRGNIQGILSPWLKSLPERFALPPKQEWSDEDEKMLKDTIRAIHLAYPYAIDDENPRKKNIDWLKSLPERFVLQPQQDRKACDVDEFSLTLRNCLYVDSELTHEQAYTFARAYGEELYKVALGEIKTGLDKEDIEEYRNGISFNPNPGDTRDRKFVEWDEDELSRYALTKAYEAYPMSVRNICNNEWNAKRDGYRYGYEQAVKELFLPKPNKEGC